VHGDPEVKPKFGHHLKDTRVEIPEFQQEFEL
jgi:hypothetical protein